MSVRKIKKSYISCVGYFKSYKNNKQLAFESILERDFFTILEFDDTVIAYEEQPLQIKYVLNGSVTKYTPDVMVTCKDGTKKVFEVKYQNEIDSDEELQNKLSVLKEVIPAQTSFPFEIFTDKQLNSIYLKNCVFLYKYAFLIQVIDMQAIVSQAIKNQQEPISIKKFLEYLSPNQDEQLRILPYLWRNVFENHSLIDMQRPITMSSLLQLRNYRG